MILTAHDIEAGRTHAGSVPDIDYAYQAEQWVQDCHGDAHLTAWLLFAGHSGPATHAHGTSCSEGCSVEQAEAHAVAVWRRREDGRIVLERAEAGWGITWQIGAAFPEVRP
jgi:hypothetical protein